MSVNDWGSSTNRWLMEHHHVKNLWIHYHIKQEQGFYAYSPPVLPSSMPPTFHEETGSSSTSPSGSRISPAVLFIIIILAVLFFISGLLHLLVRFLIKHPSSSGSSNSNQHQEISGSDVLQRQLQQLFHLHDSGLDQAFIDALPVFQYKEIVGLKEPFDCAVCLCEFTEKDKLRLLPACSHAFHINCIDTWLLSNSTCPLCRGTLFSPGFENPIFSFDDFREDDDFDGIVENGFGRNKKTAEIEEVIVKKGVLPVRLGKFRRLNGDQAVEASGETSSSNLDARRCFSMGSYQYVLADSNLRVALNKNRYNCDLELMKGSEQNGDPSPDGQIEGKKIGTVSKGESFSVSKIWLWPKKGKFSSTPGEEINVPSLNLELPTWLSRKQES